MFNNATSPLTLQWSQERNPANNLAPQSSGTQQNNVVTQPQQPTGGQTTAVDNGIDQAAAAAAAARAAELARLAAAQGDVRNRIAQIKNTYNSRYGMVDQLAKEQTDKLNSRFGDESADLLKQVDTQNQQLGAAHAAAGTYDSSYRGNNVDTVTNQGQSQIRDLGTELQDNIGNVGKWVSGQKAGFDAQKSTYDNTLNNLSQETDPNNLISLRNSLDAKIAELQAGQADYNTAGANAAALNSVAPVNARSVQLQSSLSSLVAGNSDPSMKLAIGRALITNSGLTPDEQQRLLTGLQGDITNQAQKDQTTQAQ